MLFLDGADVLLGKRSTVKDARDRYVNSEISYLLQSLEEDEGIGILTTNLKETMGDACLRQRHPLVDFLFPGETCGHLIWARMGGMEDSLGGLSAGMGSDESVIGTFSMLFDLSSTEHGKRHARKKVSYSSN